MLIKMGEDFEDIQQELLSEDLPKEKVLALRKKLWNYQSRNLSLLMNQDRLRRYNYLSGLLDVFPQFAKVVSNVVSKNSDPNQANDKPTRQKSRRHRLTEKEEDEQLLNLKEESENSMIFAFEQTPSYIKHSPLRDYQIQGLNWLISLFHNGLNGILADEMGLGKTLQTIALIGYLKHYEGIFGPHIIIVPKSILQNWYLEFKKWVPSVDVFIFHGNKPERADLAKEKLSKCDFEVCVTSYEICLLEKLHLKKFCWQYVIIDEAHRIKNEHSALSQIVREFKCRNRLLLTGTPLQNNIHELWTLLNFLLKDAFPDSGDFEKWFETPSDDKNSGTVVAKLHKILKPFLLRRIKMDVEKSLLPKNRINVYVGMSEMQRKWYQNLLQKDIEVVNDTFGSTKSKVARLQNIVMQLRKCCNHPYLFEGAEQGPPYVDGDHLITNSGKMVVLDQLLTLLKERGSRALIFSQMSRMLDILEDYCIYKGYEYCRIDGSTSHDDRVRNIDMFNADGSTKFIFLLTTRAGGLGINLATADTVVMYDCDWNPQVDLQAEDRAHRIGQKKQITVYVMITENAVEEKIIDRATQKLRLDQLVIQQGRSTHHGRTSTKEELLEMVQHGAKDIFKSSFSNILNDNIDEVIRRSHEKSKKLNERYSNMSFEDLQKFTISGDSPNIYEWEGTNFKEKEKSSSGLEWIGPTKRERKPILPNYLDMELQKPSPSSNRVAKDRSIKPFKSLTIHDFQFYPDGLKELLKKEAYAFKKLTGYKPKKEDVEFSEEDDIKAKLAEEQHLISSAKPLTPQEIEEKEKMIAQGFPDWTRRDFSAFCKASERLGRNDYESIAKYIGTKTVQEVKNYAKRFWESYEKLDDHERIIKNIKNGEIRLIKAKAIQNLIMSKIKKFHNPPYKLNIPYARNKSKNYSSEEDSYILTVLAKYGYGTEDVYDKILADIRNCATFKFNWFFKSRTPLEIHRRCNTLISMMTRKGSKKLHNDSAPPKKRKWDKITNTPESPSSKHIHQLNSQKSSNSARGSLRARHNKTLMH